MSEARQKLEDNCIGCNSCIRNCSLLSEIGSIRKLLETSISEDLAASCMDCGLCETVCPKKLSPRAILYEARVKHVSGRENSIVSLTSPDRRKTSYQLYREYYHIDYSQYEDGKKTQSVFFPGCALASYMPDLTLKLFEMLKEKGLCEQIFTGCCTRNFTTYGCLERANEHSAKLRTIVNERGISRIVTACINCYHSLKEVFKDTDVVIETVYDLLDLKTEADHRTYSVHDSCPDRNDGKFARASRRLLKENGFKTVEMKHSLKHSICCGNGGGAQHRRPKYSEQCVETRIQEAKDANVDVIVVYCPLCGMKYVDNPEGIEVMHILEIMTGKGPGLAEAKRKSSALFEGEEGRKRKEALYKEPIINNL